jgi:CspA family cold shock protein
MDENANVMTGTVRNFDDARGYGFIRVDGVTEDIFVHQQSIKMEGFRTLAAGDVVQFKIARDEKGLKARDVVRASIEQPAQPAKA